MGGRTTQHQQSLYLSHEHAKLLDKLSAETTIRKAELLREAVRDLLKKYGKLKRSKP